MTNLTLLHGPAIEPVSPDEARLHLRLNQSDEDVLITSLITAARMLVESRTARALINQSWQACLSVRTAAPLSLPLKPVQAVESVFIRRGEEERRAAQSEYRLEGDALRIEGVLPDEKVRIIFSAGYGSTAETVPQPLRQAILRLVAFWFENRGERLQSGANLPAGVAALLAPYQPVRL